MDTSLSRSDGGLVLAYELDVENLITRIDGDWDGFALRNGGSQIVRASVEGRSLWSFIQDAETRMVLGSILDRVRSTGTEVVLPFRCDAPARRRFMELHVYRTSSGSLRVESAVRREVDRLPIPLLDPNRLSRGEPLRVCSWCKRVVLASGLWVEVEAAVQQLRLFDASTLPPLSHGMCPDCAATIEIDLPPPGARG